MKLDKKNNKLVLQLSV